MALMTKTAWVVTWDWSGDHAKVEDRVVAVLNYRLSSRNVSLFIEQLYCSYEYSHADKLSVAIRRKENPYPAEYAPPGITCGHNPWLYARKVSILRIEKDVNGDESLVWDEKS